MSDGDLTRLPKWAQRRIAALTSQVDSLEAELAVGPEGSNTFSNPRYPGDGMPLGKDAHIRYVLETYEDGHARRYFDARLEDDQLYLSGSDGLLIQPQATNLVRLRLGR